ncbi:MAG: Uma2 family endonuclease [Desulfotomaculales bacterium]
MDERGCKGSPDLIVEVTSPGTASIDYIKKLALYEKHGVKEYWLVHPTDEIVMVYRLGADGKYGRPEIYARNDRVKVGLFENFYLSLEDIFTET